MAEECEHFAEEYRRYVDAFFEKEEFLNKDFRGMPLPAHSQTFGHVWVVGHRSNDCMFDTLTVEPPEGGQYEIAVRIRCKSPEADDEGVIFPGYVARCGYMTGKGTGGH